MKLRGYAKGGLAGARQGTGQAKLHQRSTLR